MNIAVRRLDPNVPDPVESRRRGVGRLVRTVYALGVLAVLAFFAVRFGAPLVLLGGPGIVSAPKTIVSLPYVVQIQRMDAAAGARVEAGANVAAVRSPQVDEVIANLTRAQADLVAREADLRIRSRIAQASLASARSRLRIAEEAQRRLEGSSSPDSVSVAYRTEVYREQAQAVQNVAALEAEAAEAATQLPRLVDTQRQTQAQLERIQKDFDNGLVRAPAAGIVGAYLGKAGETVVAGSSIAEIFQADDVYIDWYIPDFRLVDPQPGHRVIVVAGTGRVFGTVTEILPLASTFDPKRSSSFRDPQAGQMARVRLDPGVQAPPLNATVYIHMYYSGIADSIARGIVTFFRLG